MLLGIVRSEEDPQMAAARRQSRRAAPTSAAD
jgi:hypothetical protein